MLRFTHCIYMHDLVFKILLAYLRKVVYILRPTWQDKCTMEISYALDIFIHYQLPFVICCHQLLVWRAQQDYLICLFESSGLMVMISGFGQQGGDWFSGLKMFCVKYKG